MDNAVVIVQMVHWPIYNRPFISGCARTFVFAAAGYDEIIAALQSAGLVEDPKLPAESRDYATTATIQAFRLQFPAPGLVDRYDRRAFLLQRGDYDAAIDVLKRAGFQETRDETMPFEGKAL